jgi:uncharacterized protein
VAVDSNPSDNRSQSRVGVSNHVINANGAADDAMSPGRPEPIAASIADGVERSLDPRVIALDRTIGRIVLAIVAAANLFALTIVVITSLLSGSPPIWVSAGLVVVWVVVIAAIAWFLHRWPELSHRHARYRLDGDGIEIRRGVYWRTVINVPRSRVQHTDVSQSPLERRWDLATVVIYTAGTIYAKVALRGVDHATALRIRDHLLPLGGADGV